MQYEIQPQYQPQYQMLHERQYRHCRDSGVLSERMVSPTADRVSETKAQTIPQNEDHGPEQTGTTRRYGSLPTGSHHTTGSLLMPARTWKDYKESPSRNKDYHQG